jgi:UPF0755 protein
LAEPTFQINHQQLEERKKENRIVRRIVFIIVALIVIAVGAMAAGGYLYVNNALKPVDSESQEAINVSIPIGSSVSQIGQILEGNGIIKDALIFRYYVKYKNETGFQAGDYELTPAMKLEEIIESLKNGKVLQNAALKITIPEGLRLTEIAEKIAKETKYSTEEVINKLQEEEFISSLASTYSMIDKEIIMVEGIIYPLEGYLFPATYEFVEEDPELEKIIQKMVAKMQKVVDKYKGNIDAGPYRPHEILTLASVIEEETKKQEDRKKVSGVFYNRLEAGMPLGSDVTILYAQQDHRVQVLYSDLEVESAYNTYQNSGLPIGPIASPGEAAIEAVVNPEKVNDLYFYARPNGEVIYNQTLKAHNETAKKYKPEWEEVKEKNNNS